MSTLSTQLTTLAPVQVSDFFPVLEKDRRATAVGAGEAHTTQQLEPLYNLTNPQIRALPALLAGKNIVQVAEIAGVNRCTVHRWLREDLEFQAAYNRGRQTMIRSLRGRLTHIAEKAVGCVEAAIEKGDARAALQLLRGLGVLGGKPGPQDSDQPQELLLQRQFEYCQQYSRSRGVK